MNILDLIESRLSIINKKFKLVLSIREKRFLKTYLSYKKD
jgi:hypothetical protein